MRDRDDLDMEELLGRPAFLRFLFFVIQTSGMTVPATNGADGRDLAFREGRRTLGLDLLRRAASGQPKELEGDPAFHMTLIAALREGAQPQEGKIDDDRSRDND